MAVESLTCFKAYDIRGVVPDELDAELAYKIAQAYVDIFQPEKSIVIGRDVRPSGTELCDALIRGFNNAGVDVIDIGLCGTEEVYFAVFHLGLSGGIMVTASHNPTEYNGMKFVREKAIPISSETGLQRIAQRITEGDLPTRDTKGTVKQYDIRPEYIQHILAQVDTDSLRPLRIACNPGNGCAGPVIEAIQEHLPFEFIMRHEQPDGTFPNGVPNPMLPENRAATAELVVESGADFGVAWDGDFDRCFFFDENGRFIEGYYVVGLLAEAMLQSHPGESIIYDPRLTWNTIELVESLGGKPIMWKSGHAFIKEKMRSADALYGGEMSAHHYFRAFEYCDSGMLPWLLVAELLSQDEKPLSERVAERIARYPCSGEINKQLARPKEALDRLEEVYGAKALHVDYVDGLSVEFPQWRFNVRLSNTEPLLRLNVETRGDKGLLHEKTEEVLRVIEDE